jgi:protein required for attachment to host cells
MPVNWVLVADACRARIFESQALGKGMREVEDHVNPTGRAHGRDLLAENGRHTYANAGARQGYSSQPRSDPVEHEVETFAKRLADRLEKARLEGRYGRLYVIAPPRFLGLLRDKRTKDVERLVEREVPKDVARLDPGAIVAQIWG